MHRSLSLSRALAVTVLVTAIAAGAAAAAIATAESASAATPSPSPTSSTPTTTLEYAVTVTGTSTRLSTGVVTPIAPSTDHLHVDCSSKPCVLEEFASLPVKVPGSTHTVKPGSGAPCSNDYVGTETIDITIGATFTAALDQKGSGLQTCSGGSLENAEVSAQHEDITGTLVSGDRCLVVAPCALAGGPTTGDRPRTFATPGVLSTLPTAADAARPANLLWAAALTVILVILIALPTSLLNSAVEHGTERLGVWRKRVWPALSRTAALKGSDAHQKSAQKKPVALTGWPLAAAGVLAASLISSFVDPSFGFNGSSVRTFLSILVSFLLDAVAGWFILIWLVRRAIPGATARFTFAPATLLIVVVAVLFTRLTGFQPGIVFGLVAGVTFGAVVATADKARNALIGLGYSFVAALIGWVGYGLLAGVSHPNGFVVFVQETFSSMAIGGIAALPIALVPLRGLTGHAVFTWNRWAWAGAYAIGLFGFFFVLMPFPFAWKGVPLSIGVWIGIYLLYAVVAVVGWLVLARPWRKELSASAPE